MKNLRLLFLVGSFVMYCIKNSTSLAAISIQESIQERATAYIYSNDNNLTHVGLINWLKTQENGQDLIGNINAGDERGETVLHRLLKKQNAPFLSVTLLLQRNANVLMVDQNQRTPLDEALEKVQDNKTMFNLLFAEIFLTHPRLVEVFQSRQVRAFNPNVKLIDIDSDPTSVGLKPKLDNGEPIANQYYENLIARLKAVLKYYDISVDVLQDIIDSLQVGEVRNRSSIQRHINLLQAYIHVNNLKVTPEDLRIFNIKSSFELLGNNVNLLHLAGDRRNIRLAHCICTQIYFPWDLYFLSRTPGTGIRRDMYDSLKCDEIQRTINGWYRRFSLYGVLATAVAVVCSVAPGAVSAYLGGLILEKT